jgi:DivIVA domain-containing protein
MALNPDEIERMRFTATRRGYDTGEVDTFLAWLANELRTADDFDRAGTEVATALRRLHRSVLDIQGVAEDEASQLRRDADAYAADVRAEAEADAKRMRDEAEAEAATIRADAEAEREAFTSAAREHLAHAQRVLADADADSRTQRAEADAYLESVNVLAERSARDKASAALRDLRDDLARLVYERETVRGQLRQLRASIASVIESATEADDTDAGTGTAVRAEGGSTIDLTGSADGDRPVELQADEPDPIDALVDETVNDALTRSPRPVRPF